MNGIVIGRWSDFGLRVVAEYPREFRKTKNIQDSSLQSIFNERIVQDKPGFKVIEHDGRSIATYYSHVMNSMYEENEVGEDPGKAIVFLFLSKGKSMEPIKEQFIEFSISILNFVSDGNFSELFLNIIDNLSFLEPLSEEQRYAAIYCNEIREQMLRKFGEGPTSRQELEAWIVETFNLASIDLAGLLSPFIKTGLLKETFERVNSKKKEKYYYLIRDVYLFRIPPRKIIDDFKKGKLEVAYPESRGYYDEVKEYFEEYELTPTDIGRISKLLAIPNIYKIILQLREGFYEFDEFRIDFLDIFNYLPSNFEYLLRLLEKSDIVNMYKCGDHRYLALKSDIQFQVFFPEYIVDNIRKVWREDDIEKTLAVRHLTFLRDEYLENFAKLTKKQNGDYDLTTFDISKSSPEGDEAGDSISIFKKISFLLGKT